MNDDTLIFDLEASDKPAAFFALYAGLRMYLDQRNRRVSDPQKFSIAAAEAYVLLQLLKEQAPKRFHIAQREYESVYLRLTDKYLDAKTISEEPHEIKHVADKFNIKKSQVFAAIEEAGTNDRAAVYKYILENFV